MVTHLPIFFLSKVTAIINIRQTLPDDSSFKIGLNLSYSKDVVQKYIHIFFCLISSIQSHQQRIATLYLPFISIILENKHRLTPKETLPCPTSSSTLNTHQHSSSNTLDSSHSRTLPSDASLDSALSVSARESGVSSGDSSLTPRSSQSLTRRYQKDPSVFAMISGQGTFIQYLT